MNIFLPHPPVRTSRGFTLVELLAVMTIMAILLVLVSLGLQSVLGTAFNSESAEVANTLVRARAYAMANNTYVFVGIEEVDASVPANTTPQGQGTGKNGRLGVVVVTTNDGTRGYDPNNIGASAFPVAPTTLTVVAPVQRFANLHLLPSPSPVPTVNPKVILPNTTGATSNVQVVTTSSTAFNWPLGGGTAQYQFGAGVAPGSVIQFDPQGQAQIISTAAGSASVLQWIELDLQPTHGKTVPAAVTDAATILIDGPSGSVSLYRS